ncbi:hypothetical protein RRG08_067180 [Elysia crispata]|uniref:Uncharacterized protein n=1 Tax=Elysia crispata TaxID=231223 RepID=A0AAE1DA13_9GAST|nr:hypothetical protein RRG08_067180 [Elysia crispata]
MWRVIKLGGVTRSEERKMASSMDLRLKQRAVIEFLTAEARSDWLARGPELTPQAYISMESRNGTTPTGSSSLTLSASPGLSIRLHGNNILSSRPSQSIESKCENYALKTPPPITAGLGAPRLGSLDPTV